MSPSDYEFHLSSEQFSHIFDTEDGSDAERHPFSEDMDEIDRIIEEEIGKPRRGRRRKRP